MSRRIVGPFNRVEGDLEVQLETADGQVRDAWVVAPMYRGFEQMLQGRAPLDALVYVPRICGICSVSQSLAAARAIAGAQGLAMPPNGELATNLILATENLADHLTHFYLFFMPDFAREAYRGQAWFSGALERFRALQGTAARQVLPVRAEWLHLTGLLAGRWPHSLALQPGGASRSIEHQERARAGTLIHAFRRFLEQTLFGDDLESVVALDSADALASWARAAPPRSSDFRHFLHISDALGLERLGRGADRFMSYGAYPREGRTRFRTGVWAGGDTPLDPGAISEEISHSWMHHQSGPRHPYEGVTLPSAEQPGAYTWCKAPRLGGEVMEARSPGAPDGRRPPADSRSGGV
ncbi:MAG: nickel-dependent hydrogenase large subunit [Candidatus Sedimenticola endophacoides]